MPSKKPASQRISTRLAGVNPLVPAAILANARNVTDLMFWGGLITETQHTQMMGTINSAYRQVGNGGVTHQSRVIPLQQQQAS